MKTCVFIGPSAGSTELRQGIDRFCPASQGSVFLAVESGYRRIGLVDGYFGNVPSVWHKEILFALAHGVEVYGSASMGALRAAELSGYGMIGAGRIYRCYRRGLISDDDEVCVIHAVKEMRFLPLSISMVAIRHTLRRLRRKGVISTCEELRISDEMKSLHFPLRTRTTLLASATEICGADREETLAIAFDRFHTDLKNEDFGEMLRQMDAPVPCSPPRLCWKEIETRKWKPQFVDQVADIEPLERW